MEKKIYGFYEIQTFDKLSDKQFHFRYKTFKKIPAITRGEFDILVENLMVESNYNLELVSKKLINEHGFEECLLISKLFFNIDQIRQESGKIEDLLKK